MKSLKFKNNHICDEGDVVLATLSIREHVPDSERYVVYLQRIFDNMKVSDLRECVRAANELQPTTIIEAAMKDSFVKKVEDKLHQCMLATDFTYRLAYELSECREKCRVLDKALDEARKKRWELEREVSDLKSELQSLKKSESEFESESETETD